MPLYSIPEIFYLTHAYCWTSFLRDFLYLYRTVHTYFKMFVLSLYILFPENTIDSHLSTLTFVNCLPVT